jgi:glucose-1-phosphate adenylyltransferase
MALIDSTLGLILACNADPALQPLTRLRAKAAIPFGGTYRIIDFTLANCLRSGLRRMLVLTYAHSYSLQKHLRDGWSIFNPELGEFVTAIPPPVGLNSGVERPDLRQMLMQIRTILDRNRAEFFLLLSGEHIYRMDYAALLDFHAEQGADVTAAVIAPSALSVQTNQPAVLVDDDRRIEQLLGESPADEQAGRRFLMGVYVVSRQVLLEILSGPDTHDTDISEVVVKPWLRRGRVLAYDFGGLRGRVTPDQYWNDVCDLDAFYQANMDLLKTTPPIDLYQLDWPIRTYQSQNPPARTVPGRSCNEGIFVNSIVGSGSVIAGGGVNHSVLFSRVHVEDAAIVENAILFMGVRIGEGARVSHCIIDKGVHVPPHTQIGVDPKADAQRFAVSPGGVVVVEKGFQF